MPVERSLGVTGRGGDLVDAGLPVAAVGEDPQRRRQELVAPPAPLCPGCARTAVDPCAFQVLHHPGSIPTERSVCTSSTSSPALMPAAPRSSCSTTSGCPT